MKHNSEVNVNTEKYESDNPLKNSPFFAIPRHIALLPGLTDRVFRLMAIRYTEIEDEDYKDLNLISTELTGRSIIFYLSTKGGKQ